MLDIHTVEFDEEVRRGLLLAFPKMQFIDDRLNRLPSRVKQTIVYLIGFGTGDHERIMIQKCYDGFRASNPHALPNYNRKSTFRSRLQTASKGICFTTNPMLFQK